MNKIKMSELAKVCTQVIMGWEMVVDEDPDRCYWKWNWIDENGMEHKKQMHCWHPDLDLNQAWVLLKKAASIVQPPIPEAIDYGICSHTHHDHNTAYIAARNWHRHQSPCVAACLCALEAVTGDQYDIEESLGGKTP